MLSPNQFVLIKANIKNGWINQETGKPGDPRVEVTDVLQLQDTLEKLCKKLIIKIDIQQLSQNTIKQLSELFAQNKGEHQIVFEISEIEKVKKQIEIALKTPEENLENEEELTMTENNNEIEVVEENKVINQILMPSRKTKVKISNELLSELEKLQVKFKLN